MSSRGNASVGTGAPAAAAARGARGAERGGLAIQAVLLEAVQHVVGRRVAVRRQRQNRVGGVAKDGDVAQRVVFDARHKRLVDVELRHVVECDLYHSDVAPRHLLQHVDVVQRAVLGRGVVGGRHLLLAQQTIASLRRRRHGAVGLVKRALPRARRGAVGTARRLRLHALAERAEVLQKVLGLLFLFAKLARQHRSLCRRCGHF
jgi:hypothetical protein